MGRLFGTDGVRRIANVDLTCELAMEIGRAAAVVLRDSNRRHLKFILGKDPRISSDMLEAAIVSGLCSVGADVITLGVIPTPAVAYLVGKYKADAGIMISASHNPFEFNGIKIFSGDGYKLPDELEDRIESIIFGDVENAFECKADVIGMVKNCSNAIEDYIEHLKSTVAYSLDGLKLAVDCSNGAASFTAPKLFSELGAECEFLSCTPDGININCECGSTNMNTLSDFLKNGDFDAGIAFDGDADRCLAMDSSGNIVDGDFIMAICAKDMKSRGKLAKNTIVGTVMTNMGLNRFCSDNQIGFSATKVGDRFVLEEMLLEGYNLGGEQSGHIIFSDFATTGDGQLTAIQLLSLLRRKNDTLANLSSVLKQYPQIIVNVPVTDEEKISFYTDSEIKQAINSAKEELGDDGRIIVRVSGTEPLIRVMVEGIDYEFICKIADSVAEKIKHLLNKGW